METVKMNIKNLFYSTCHSERKDPLALSAAEGEESHTRNGTNSCSKARCFASLSMTVLRSVKLRILLYTQRKASSLPEKLITVVFFWIFGDILGKIISENLRFFQEKTRKNVTKSLF